MRKKKMNAHLKKLPPSVSSNNIPAEMTSKHDRASVVYFQSMQITRKISTDQMGRFRKTSSNGIKYVMTCYAHDTNEILTECLKSREDKELTRAFTVIYDCLIACGNTPKIQLRDNECPPGLEAFMTKNKIAYQLVPSHEHRSSSAEKISAPRKTTLLRVSPVLTLSSPSTSGIVL